MLMPVVAFTEEMANIWKETMVTAEEAQILAMMLLSKTNHAKATSIAWLKEGRPLPSVCSCLCLRHIIRLGSKLRSEEIQFIKNLTTQMLPTANLHLRKAIQALKESLSREEIQNNLNS